MKKKLGILAVLVLSFGIISCGKKEATPEPVAEQVAEPAEKEVTVAEYKESISKINERIAADMADFQKAQQAAMANPAKAVEEMTPFVEKLKEAYKEISEVKAPESLQGAADKLKEGCAAYSEMLDATLEILGNPSKAAELTPKIQELQQKASVMTEAVQEINAAN